MAHARRSDQWQQTGTIVALLANIHRDKKRKPSPFKASDFNPVAPLENRRRGVPLDDIRMLKAFVPGLLEQEAKERKRNERRIS